MERYLGRFAPHLFAVLRIVGGLMFMMHGTQKLFGWPGNRPPRGDAAGIIAGVIEVAGGALIAIGLYAGWAAFLASGLMAVAYFWRHQPEAFLPIVNRGELAVLYCFLWLYVAAHGAGVWSVDGKRAGETPARQPAGRGRSADVTSGPPASSPADARASRPR